MSGTLVHDGVRGAAAAATDSVQAKLQRSLPGRLALLKKERPGAVALREKRFGLWNERTWSDYYGDVAATAHALWNLGVRSGDHIAILSDNRTEWLYADLAAQGIGARSVGIYQTNPPADVAYILEHSGCRILFCEDQEQVDKAIEVAARTPTVEKVVVFDPRGTRHYEDARLLKWEEFYREGLLAQEQAPDWFEEKLLELDGTEATMVVYTSGTTGQPKGAMISSHNALASAVANAELLGASEKDTMLSYLPLCHVAEKIFTVFLPLATGAVVHFGESIETVRQDLVEVSPTVFLGVPRIWEKMHANVLLKMKDASWLKRALFHFFTKKGRTYADKARNGTATAVDKFWAVLGDLFVFRALQERLGLRRCRIPITGAAPLSAEIIHWFHGIGVPILEGYGQTECAGVSHVNRPDATRIGTVGQALPGIECELADDGEVLVRGKNVFVGYLNNDEATAKTVDEQGWLHTGDIGSIDDAGFLTITGRKKEIIITAGGKNLSPEKIENALKTSPYVKEAIAIGDRRKFIAALIQIDYDAVGDWASRKDIPYTSFEDLAQKPEVHDLIKVSVDRANDLLARVEHVRAFRLLQKELHQDDGELTATQKVRRRAISTIYADLIESMY